jgi:hypothetical protein
MSVVGCGVAIAGLRFAELILMRRALLGDMSHIETHPSCNVAQRYNSILVRRQCHLRIFATTPIRPQNGIYAGVGLAVCH